MNLGMLWFDNDAKKTVEFRVREAAQYYTNKYARIPNLVFVHPNMLTAEQKAVAQNGGLYFGTIEVRPNRSVLPHHFWVGFNG